MRSFNSVGHYITDTMIGAKGVPSCDIIVMKDHEVLYRYYDGFSNKSDKTPISPTAHYFMYSCTKPITAAVVMHLVEMGCLELDAPVSKYLPSFTNLNVLINGSLEKASTTLTVKHLLTMTGGYDYAIKTDPYVQELLSVRGEAATTLELIDAYSKRPLLFEPGSAFEYSICHDILAGIVEVIVGKPFHVYVDEVLFTPLGMKNSTFRHDKKIVDQVIDQYIFENNEVQLMEKKNYLIVTPQYDSGGAGLVSCTDDYCLFADMMACEGTSKNGYQFLKPETIRLMSESHITSKMLHERKEIGGCGPDYSYGLGVRTRTTTQPGSSPIGEFGWDGAAGSYVLIDPYNHVSIFLAMHLRNWYALIGKDHQVLRDLVYESLEIT